MTGEKCLVLIVDDGPTVQMALEALVKPALVRQAGGDLCIANRPNQHGVCIDITVPLVT